MCDISFTNCLVAMRPKTSLEDLPSRYKIRTMILNEYATYLADLRNAMAAAPGHPSFTWDMWSKDHTSEAFVGVIVQWIKVAEDGTWSLESKVLAFHRVYGDHGGVNIARHLVKLLDRAGVTTETTNNVCDLLADIQLKLNSLCSEFRQDGLLGIMPRTTTQPSVR